MDDIGFIIFLLVIAVVWSAIWKGVALWKAARYGQKAWFVVLMVVNTIGLLEIVYLAFFQKKPIQRVMRPVKPVASAMPKKAAKSKR